jgi:hypothetical protein
MRNVANRGATAALTVAVSALVAVVGLLMLERADAQSSPAIWFEVNGDEGCVSVDEGDEFEVAVLISGAEDLQSWEATVTYDRDVLEVTQHNTRLFLGEESGSNLLDASEPLPDVNGRHFLSVGDLSAASESGTGVLSTITFRAIDSGVSVIDSPQVDLNGDGRTDEGSALTSYGNVEISDVNGDAFFDGPVQSAVVAIEANCSQATPKPTDPPTAAPSATTSEPDASGASQTGDVEPSGSATDGTASPGSVEGTPTTGGSASDEPAESEDATRGTAGSQDDGDSFQMWIVAALIAAGLASAGGLGLLLRLRKPGGGVF